MAARKKNKEEKVLQAGLDAILSEIKRLYPEQDKNHVQHTAMIKFWMGGPDPLDYVSVLVNKGNEEEDIPPHWHYISFGFTDLDGDGNVHEFSGPGQPSGFGFELTLRLKKDPDDTVPPIWPSALMNSLARYVFQTGSVLDVNDHIPWKPLDQMNDGPPSNTKIKNMLIAKDPQIKDLDTPNGTIQFRQIVGVMDDELRATQQWNGAGMLKLLSQEPRAAGRFFVLDMTREESLFSMQPHLKQVLSEGISKDGSNLGVITASFHWEDPEVDAGEVPVEKKLKFVNINLTKDAADLVPIIIKGRLKKGQGFTMSYPTLNQTIVFIPPGIENQGVLVSEGSPIVADQGTLQIFCSKSFQGEMTNILKPLETMKNITTDPPTVFQLHNPNVKIAIVKEEDVPKPTGDG